MIVDLVLHVALFEMPYFRMERIFPFSYSLEF